MMMSISPFGHKAMGDLFRRCETYSRQPLYVVKTTYPFSIEASVNPLSKWCTMWINSARC